MNIDLFGKKNGYRRKFAVVITSIGLSINLFPNKV